MVNSDMDSDSAYADEANGHIQDDLRQQTSSLLLERIDFVTADTVAIFPYSGAEALDTDYCRRLGLLLAQLLAFAVRDGRVDAGAASSPIFTASCSNAGSRWSGCSRSPT